jgi:hypothetical protein
VRADLQIKLRHRGQSAETDGHFVELEQRGHELLFNHEWTRINTDWIRRQKAQKAQNSTLKVFCAFCEFLRLKNFVFIRVHRCLSVV